jgi:hypothetical protein
MKAISPASFEKSLVNSKAAGVELLRTYKFNILLKGEIKIYEQLMDHLQTWTYPII